MNPPIKTKPYHIIKNPLLRPLLDKKLTVRQNIDVKTLPIDKDEAQMSYSDPLGIQAAIDKMQEWHKLNPITEEMAEDWNNHPVTRHLKQYLQIDLHKRLYDSQEPAPSEVKALYELLLNFPIVEASQ